MKRFEINQSVTVMDNEAAHDFGLDSEYVSLIGETFTVKSMLGANAVHKGWYVPPGACELAGAQVNPHPTTFQRVAEMNTAFGNPKGNPENIDLWRIRNQAKNIFDEYLELQVALGLNRDAVEILRAIHTRNTSSDSYHTNTVPILDDVRDALADIKVFADGASHLMGCDGDADMHVVVDAVFTRFIKDDEDKLATYEMHAAKGVEAVYFEGEYPKLIMKSAEDQPDAPKGKFLKSASYGVPVFPKP